jgi:hypothetical protein
MAVFLGLVMGYRPAIYIAMDHVWIGRIWAFGIFALALVVALRVMRMALVVTPDRIVLRGLWRTRSLPLSDVVRFEPPIETGMLGQTGLRVILTNGRTLAAGVFYMLEHDNEPVGVAESAELNAWLSLHRSPD